MNKGDIVDKKLFTERRVARFYERDDAQQPRGLATAYVPDSGDRILFGFSYCMPADQFVKATARIKAEGRMASGKFALSPQDLQADDNALGEILKQSLPSDPNRASPAHCAADDRFVATLIKACREAWQQFEYQKGGSDQNHAR